MELRPGIMNISLDENMALPAREVLEGAIGEELATVVVIGRERSGELYIASSISMDPSLALLLRAQAALVSDDLMAFADQGLEGA